MLSIYYKTYQYFRLLPDKTKYNVPNITINTNIPGMLCTLYQQETQTSIYYKTYQYSMLLPNQMIHCTQYYNKY